jgi:hypothetical protein
MPLIAPVLSFNFFRVTHDVSRSKRHIRLVREEFGDTSASCHVLVVSQFAVVKGKFVPAPK